MPLGPTNAELKTRLETRYPTATVTPSTVQSIVKNIAERNWATQQDVKERKADLTNALALLDSKTDEMVDYLRTAVDLQLTKASALRTYCALVIAIAFPMFQLAN